MENSEAPGAPQEGPGDVLRRAREDAGIAPREMADQLNWLPSHVTAIEENRFGDLRSQAFVRGYLRAYAKALGLDEGPLIARFNALAAGQQPRREESPARAGAAANTGTSANTTMWVVLGLLFAAMVVVMVWMRERPVETTAATAQADSAGVGTRDVEQRAAPAAPSSAQAPPAPLAKATAEEQIVAPSGTVEAPEQAPASEPASAATGAAVPGVEEQSSVELPAPPAPAAVDEGMLQFSFSGECWLEVKDGSGELIYSDLKVAGDTLSLSGEPPFQIVAGNASVVSLRYLGEPVAVTSPPGRNLARFAVGE